MSATVNIARCPEHGLHGERTACFECGGPVEQVPMTTLVLSDDELAWLEMAARHGADDTIVAAAADPLRALAHKLQEARACPSP